MAFLSDKCARVPLTPKIVAACAPFSCGNKDLDEFFAADYSDYASQLMGKTYAFLDIDNPREFICAFTVSNASIFTNYLPNARRKRIGKDVPQKKRDMIYPAVLIGRLGVNSKFARRHIGTELMDSIKSWFIDKDNKTGCRYLVVDAYNDDIPIGYYKRNGFDFMFSTVEQEKQYRNITNPDRLRTRLMFFDLMHITPAATASETD